MESYPIVKAVEYTERYTPAELQRLADIGQNMAAETLIAFDTSDWQAFREHLSELAAARGTVPQDWPRESLALCGRAGLLHAMSTPGVWDESQVIMAYLELAQADLTTTFVLTQYLGACRRIMGSDNQRMALRWLNSLLSGERFATVGFSHLTTSRRHLGSPVLHARPIGNNWLLSGYSPWVTGAAHADLIVAGATLDDRREILVAVPTDRAGVTAGPGAELVALSGSCTDQVEFHEVEIHADELLAGPIEDVMSSGVGAGTGGLQTSTLAIGLSRAAIAFLINESVQRPDLRAAADNLQQQADALQRDLLQIVNGSSHCTTSELRTSANSLALRSTQATLAAAKGAGFMSKHPTGRWCREALFFLVWSCPQPVMQANLCELAGLR